MKKTIILLSFLCIGLSLYAQRLEKPLTAWQYCQETELDKQPEKGWQESILPQPAEGNIAFWYRTTIKPPFKQHVELSFDGNMPQAQVFINGKEVYRHDNNLNTFAVDITQWLVKGGNEIAVRQPSAPLQQPYVAQPGARLIQSADTHIPLHGVQINTTEITEKRAIVNIHTEVVASEAQKLRLNTEIYLGKQLVGSTSKTFATAKGNAVDQPVSISWPHPWSPESPIRYTAVINLYEGKVLLDSYTQPFGIRNATIEGDSLLLNGIKQDCRGVTLEPDYSILAATRCYSDILHHLELLKDMGANMLLPHPALLSKELITIADSIGMMVLLQPTTMDVLPYQNNASIILGENVTLPKTQNDLHSIVPFADVIGADGKEKDLFYLYRSHWNKRSHTLHICSDWNKQEDEQLSVSIYTDYPEAELFVNGSSQGRRSYPHTWQQVAFEEGELSVAAFNSKGMAVLSDRINTAGEPFFIELVQRKTGKLSYVTIRICDFDGNLCPMADNLLHIAVSGTGRLLGIEDTEKASFVTEQNIDQPAYKGTLTIIVSGSIDITVSADNIKGENISIK